MNRVNVATLWLVGAVSFFVAFVLLPVGSMGLETIWDGERVSFAPWRDLLNPSTHKPLAISIGLGVAASCIAVVLGLSHAWLTWRTDLPLARILGPLGVLPLALPPIVVAMAFSDLVDATGMGATALLLGLGYAPFVAVMATRGLRSISGDAFDAARLARGRAGAERWLLRAILPEVATGALLAFVFAISEHGVPEFLTVKGKAWHTYAETIFALWTRRATGIDHSAIASPIVAAIPLVLIMAIALTAALRLRGHASLRGEHRPLPIRSLGKWRFPALAIPLAFLGCGVGVPVLVMSRWAAGSTDATAPASIDRAIASFRLATSEAGGDLSYTIKVAIATTALLMIVAVPLAWIAARRHRWVDYVSVLPIAMPAVLLGMGMVRVFNRDLFFEFYDRADLLVAAYAARFLPFGVLALSGAIRRVPFELEEAAALSRRGRVVRAVRIKAPLFVPAIWSAACLVLILALRELDLAVLLPAGNGTVVRRLSNIVHFGGEDMGGALALLLLLAGISIPVFTILFTGRKLSHLS